MMTMMRSGPLHRVIARVCTLQVEHPRGQDKTTSLFGIA
jgi:hypothetical protein